MEKEKLLLNRKIQINLTDNMKTQRSWGKMNTIMYTSTYTKCKNRQTKCGGTGQNTGYFGGIQIRTEPKGTFCDAKKISIPWSR